MKKKSKSGFLLAETIIVSMVVITALIIIYIQFINITKNYQNSMKYNNVDKLHNINQIVKFVESEDTESLVTLLNNSENRYVDLTSCDNFTEYLYCENLFDILNIKTVLLTDENTSTLVNNIKGKNLVGEGMYNFLRRISSDGTNSERIVVEFNDETFATLKLNVAYQETLLNGADPELSKNLIPVVISSNGEVKKADITSEWYKYEDKKWANAVVVNNDKQEYYNISNPNTIIDANDIAAYYVWIPRYKYEIFTDVKNLEIVGSITDSSEYVNKADIINIVFENKMTDKSTGTNKDEWLTHPAFTFGEEDLNGIWVGKFETTGTASEPTVLGYDSRYTETNNVKSLRSQKVSEQFLTSLKITKLYNLSKKSAMLKNIEWGAIAYLTNSQYGRCTENSDGSYTCEEVMINNSNVHNTGCAASVAPTTNYGEYIEQTDHSEGYYAGCENEWHTTAGQKASTTGNAYGIYDMSGGAWEYVMGVIETATDSGIPASGKNNDYNSGFTGTLTYPNDGSDSSITSITGVSFPDGKYFDIYAYNTSSIVYADRGHLGDATYELDGFTNWKGSDGSTRYRSGWNQDYAYLNYIGNPWFGRGGAWNDGSDSGVFAFHSYAGYAYGIFSFRSVLR